MESPTAPIDLTLRGLEKSKSSSLGYRRIIFRKGADLNHVMFYANRKLYEESHCAIIFDQERSISWSQILK